MFQFCRPAIVCSFFIFFSMAGATYGDTILISPAIDGAVVDNAQDGDAVWDSIYGSEDEGWVDHSSNYDFERRSLFEFDISSIAQGSTVSYARFTFGGYSSGNPDDTMTLNGYTATNPASLSFADASVNNPLVEGFITGQAFDTVHLEVTSFIQNMVSSGDTLAGFMLQASPEETGAFVYMSESGYPDVQHPELYIEYSENQGSQVPVPSTLSLLITGLLIMFGGRHQIKPKISEFLKPTTRKTTRPCYTI